MKRARPVASALFGLALLMLAPASCADEPSAAGAQENPLLEALGGASRSAATAAIDEIVASKDQRFVSAFIELLRASGMGLASPAVGAASAEALAQLTGESYGTDWPKWVRWYAGTALEPPPGFVSWKGRLLAQVDPVFAELLRDEHPRRIRVEEIVWGGVPFEGIPALDRPRAIPAAEADYLKPADAVFGLYLGGEARAYPQRILDWHEMVNDELGGIPFSLAYCTLCGSGIAYDTRVPDYGDLAGLDFGSSGFLMRSNKLMVDRQTRTLWNHLTGQPVLGPLADRDITLPVLTSVVTTWQAWRKRHPETTVLSLDTDHQRNYGPGAAYAGYFASPDTMFPVRRVRTELPQKARVFGLEAGGVARAYPLTALLERKVLNDAIAGDPVVVVASGEAILIDGVSVRSGPARYDAGAAVRAFARGEREFRPGDAPDRLTDERGAAWTLTEDALVGPEGERLARRPGILAYWFGWSGFHPQTELFAATPSEG